MHKRGTISALKVFASDGVRSVTEKQYRLSKGKQKITVGDIRNYLINHNIMFSEDELKYYLHQNNFKSEITLNEYKK